MSPLRRCSLSLLTGLCFLGLATARENGKPAGPLAGELAKTKVREIVFANRNDYKDGHWYANIGYWCDDESRLMFPGEGKEPDVGRLCKLDLQTGKVTVLLDAKGGSIRDPHVHYDGKKILFSWRKNDSIYYHLHEINADGSGLRQLTDGEFDDYEPCCLPDGGIAFISTRAKRWVNCWHTQVGILYRCDADGGNIVQLSSNLEHDNTPAMLPDGRLLYQRWEYVDRNQVSFHHLWTMNPDGTGQMVYYGNLEPRGLYIDARAIPGTTDVIGIDSPGHGRRNHAGVVSLFTDRFGPNDPRGKVAILSDKKPVYMDPAPLSKDLYVVATGKSLVLMSRQGKTETLHQSEFLCHEPSPLIPRQRERKVPARVDPAQEAGQFILTDVYQGRNMEGVRRGDIKKLLVLESLPKPVNFNGGPDVTSWQGTFTLERILGTVPVEPDGSASFAVPANRPVFFVALDENDLSVKRMQSFASVAPGEVTGCTGCHEHRTRTPGAATPKPLLALQRLPSEIAPFAGMPDVIDYARDVQPVLDRHCVSCHNAGDYQGRLSLEAGMGRIWHLGYYRLFARGQVADGRNGFGDHPPRAIGTSASPLMKMIDGSHHAVKLPEKDWRTLWLWIESGAANAGSYAALRTEETAGRIFYEAGIVFHNNFALMKKRCGGCHTAEKQNALPLVIDHKDKRGVDRPLAPYERNVIPDDPLARYSANTLVDYSTPENSPLLRAPLAKSAGGWGFCGNVFPTRDDPGYRKLLTDIRASKEKMESPPRYSQEGFRPNPQYVREMKKFGILPENFDPARDKIDIFATDQAYWESLWYRPNLRAISLSD